MSSRVVREPADGALLHAIRRRAVPLHDAADLDPLLRRLDGPRLACIGEASHGTREYYRWRAVLSRRLIEEQRFNWIGVEGDWPDCWRINRWVRGHEDQDLDARGVLSRFERWPTWMWANTEVADFLDWLREHNATRSEANRVGFYGLDVYSLWDSLRRIIEWLEANAPDAVPAAMRAWQCFVPYDEDPHEYAWSTRLVPTSCEPEVVTLLAAVRARSRETADDPEGAFDALQNAEVAAGAERYYRIMVRGDRQSWNVRDRHMAATVERITAHLGPTSKGLVWAHNTHVGDARATTMAAEGMVNVGQLLREHHGRPHVGLVGFAGHRGTVLAGAAWGAPEHVMPVPVAREGSHEHLLHTALGDDALVLVEPDGSDPWLGAVRGHRAIGVVYQPAREAGNYVPTCVGERYDALLWIEDTSALVPLHHEAPPAEPELETEPTGF